MNLEELLPLLSPLALAALEAGLADSLDEMLSDDSYQKLLSVSAAVRGQGEVTYGDYYAYLAGSVAETLEDMTLFTIDGDCYD
jgi:hypothetical protein